MHCKSSNSPHHIILINVVDSISSNRGSGNNTPVSTRVMGINESYPNINKQRATESSINSEERIGLCL